MHWPMAYRATCCPELAELGSTWQLTLQAPAPRPGPKTPPKIVRLVPSRLVTHFREAGLRAT